MWHKDWFDDDLLTEHWEEQNACQIQRPQIPEFAGVGKHVIPAALHKRLGRKKKRKCDEGTKLCSACGQIGHYSVTCPAPDIVRWSKVRLADTLKGIRKVVKALGVVDDDDYSLGVA